MNVPWLSKPQSGKILTPPESNPDHLVLRLVCYLLDKDDRNLKSTQDSQETVKRCLSRQKSLRCKDYLLSSLLILLDMLAKNTREGHACEKHATCNPKYMTQNKYYVSANLELSFVCMNFISVRHWKFRIIPMGVASSVKSK